jgi:hypothetical protein
MVGEYLGLTTFEKAIEQKPITLTKVDIDKNIINDYKEINDFILAKKSTVSLLNEDNKKMVEYAKVHGIDAKEILKEIKSLHKAENKELEKDMKSSELDKNYAWYLENKENKAIKDVLETKKNTFLSEWSKEIGNLESDEKLAYLKGTNDVNFKNEIYNFSDEKIKKVLDIYTNFKEEYTTNQKEYFNNNGVEIEKEEEKEKNFHSINEINQNYLSDKEKINDILSVLKITVEDIEKTEEQIKKRNPDLNDKTIADMITNHIYDNMIKENVALIDFSKKEFFNFGNENITKEMELERYFNLKEKNSIESFDEKDLVSFDKVDYLIKDRENIINNERQYLLSNELKEHQDINYQAKKEIALILTNTNALDREIKAEMLEFKDDKLIVITPEYNAEIKTEKLTENNIDKIRNIILNGIENKTSLNDMEKLNKNNEILFNLGQRDKLREFGNSFYKDMIFDKENEIIKEIKVEIVKEKYLELSDREKVLERAKELGITLEKEPVFTTKSITKDMEDAEPNIDKDNEVTINHFENRNDIYQLFENSLYLKNALRIYEDTLDFDYKEIYPYNNLEENAKFIVGNILELIPEVKNNKNEFGIESINLHEYLKEMSFDDLELWINNIDETIKEVIENKVEKDDDYVPKVTDKTEDISNNNEDENKRIENDKEKNKEKDDEYNF